MLPDAQSEKPAVPCLSPHVWVNSDGSWAESKSKMSQRKSPREHTWDRGFRIDARSMTLHRKTDKVDFIKTTSFGIGKPVRGWRDADRLRSRTRSQIPAVKHPNPNPNQDDLVGKWAGTGGEAFPRDGPWTGGPGRRLLVTGHRGTLGRATTGLGRRQQ